jgi:pimeloyl-ACP methyl ester carboxylesterase
MREGLVAARGGELGFVHAGSGLSTVVFLHEWPQTSYAWRKVLPLLNPQLTGVALDLRGVGRSSPAFKGFDKATMAQDVHAALENLGIADPLLVVGHGIGGMVGYALARTHPERLAGLLMVDTLLPGLPGWDEAAASLISWHLGFHRDGAGARPGGHPLAEVLVQGRQGPYFRNFIDRFAAHPSAITPEALAHYVRGYLGPERLAAGFQMFRTLPLDAADNQALRGSLTVPILTAWGEYSFGAYAATFIEGLRETGAEDVSSLLIADCGHWPAEEQPAVLARIINDFAALVCER